MRDGPMWQYTPLRGVQGGIVRVLLPEITNSSEENPDMAGKKITRREFIKSSTLGASALALGAPTIIASTAFGAPGRAAPSDRINIGCIGVGSQGSYLTTGAHGSGGLAGRDDIQVVAICDVDAEHRERVADMVETIYADQIRSGKYKGCARYNDFRELLARDDIDAVFIATPDHWHVLISIAAIKAGKDVYCEKPLTYNVTEGQALVETVRRYGGVFQTGTQQRTMRDFVLANQLVHGGKIGRLKTMEVGIGNMNFEVSPDRHVPMQIPKGFDYDLWLGPAPWRPYTRGRTHITFRRVFDYSGGGITDWGAHNFDIAQWGNGTERSGPVEVDGRGTFPKWGLFDTVTNPFDVTFTYADGVRLTCNTKTPLGVKFIGTDGWIFVNRRNIDAHDRTIIAEARDPEFASRLHHHDNHWTDFLDAIRTRKDAAAPAEVGHRSTTLCHLANISMRLGRKLKWDPDNERFKGDDEANRMLSRPMRSPWRL